MPAKARSKKPKLEGAAMSLRKASLFLSEAGPFRLSAALFTHPVRQQHWIRELTSQAEKDHVLLTTVPIPPDENLRAFDLARAAYEAHPAPPGWTRGLLLTGIPDRLPDASVTGLTKIPTPRMAAELNLDRELFERFTPCPLIIALTPTAFSHLSRFAPDFMQWCSHIFDFTEPAPPSDTPPARGLMELQASLPGDIYANLTELQRAETVFRDGLTSAISVHGPDSPHTIEVRANLANVLHQMGRTNEALPLSRENLRIAENTNGYPEEKLASQLTRLAHHLHHTGHLAEAEPLMRRALAIDESSYGDSHPEVAVRLNNLALLLKDTNRLAEAEPLMRRALAIDESSYGDSHPDVAIRLNNLAQLLQATNRLEEAEPLMRRVVDIFEKNLGDSHPNVATALNNLAGLLQATNRLAEAEPLMRRALAIDEKSYGDSHPDVARDLNNLALLLQATNRLAEAGPLMRRVVEIFVDFTVRTGHPHPHLQTVIGNYAGLLMEMEKTEAQVREAIEKILEPLARRGST